MRIFITSAIIIAIGTALIIGFLSGFVIVQVSESIEDSNLANLLIIYDIKD